MWTLDELVERARVALSAEYPGAPNGRVRELPDRRAIRWYTQTGLVDRPLGMRGRTALYGPRHLLQLVALKRRQADGRTLAEIQAELAGAPDEALTAVARVPHKLLTTDLLTTDGPAPDDAGPARARFWTGKPQPLSGTARQADKSTKQVPPRITVPAPPATRDAAPIGGVALRGGAILVVPGVPTAADRAAIAAAAEPLLALLDSRGLLRSDPLDDGGTS
jgi:DNA-binding transcriptional MerR regulator